MNLLRYSKACRNKPDLPAVPETEKTHGIVRDVMRMIRENEGNPGAFIVPQQGCFALRAGMEDQEHGMIIRQAQKNPVVLQ